MELQLAAVIDTTWYATSSACKRVLCAAKMIRGFRAAWRLCELSAQLGVQADINRRLRDLPDEILHRG
jgi:hypothetical protein